MSTLEQIEQTNTNEKNAISGAGLNHKDRKAKALLQEAMTSSDAKELYQHIVREVESGMDLNYFNPLGFQKNTLLINILRNNFKETSFISAEGLEQKVWRHKIVEYLLDNGVNVNYQNGEGFTALMCATRDFQLFKLFLDKGANLYLKDNRGVDAVGYALIQTNWQTLSIIMEQGLAPEANYNDYLAIFHKWDLSSQKSFGSYYKAFKAGADIQAIKAERIHLQNQISTVAQESNNMGKTQVLLKI